MDISVIIPIYNTEKYLKRCIDSVVAQIDVSLQIILIDDGSTDSSPSICDEYEKRYDFITVRHISNSGPATAKNVGMTIAEGDYLAFIDSDDQISPNMLNEMLEISNKLNTDITCCNYTQVDENGNKANIEYTSEIITLNHEQGLQHLLMKDKIYSQCWTKIYRRSLLTNNNILNENGLHTEEDFIFNIKAFCKSAKSAIIDKPLYIYTYRKNSLSHNYFRENINDFINNRITRVKITDKMVCKESQTIIDCGYAHNIRYYNELIGKVALSPEYCKDLRIINILKYIKLHKTIIKENKKFCGFSKIGILLILHLPFNLYMKYRKYQSKD